ncbi:MAG: AzlD domain-containing protein [Chloroflexota bacterium]|nr:MAG: AzlD domain-containing protein [Chloroflexota bacterium]
MIWLTIIAAGVLTFATRLSFILLYGQIRMPAFMERALRFVPAAVLTAIFFPELMVNEGDLVLSIVNPRLLAGLLAIVVAWRTKNVIYTITIGMITLWILQYLSS